jgi:OOP family OmpA-OmpF porin
MLRPAMFALTLLAGAAVGAQADTPNSDQIIQMLKPPTRGVRVLPAGPPEHGSAATKASTSPMKPVRAPSVDLTVRFESGSATLTPEATRALDELGRALTSDTLSGYRFRIEGHTDTVGMPAANKALSDRRAAAVASYLEERFGVTANRLEPVGMGQSAPLVATPPQTDEPRNRRVHVVNLGA